MLALPRQASLVPTPSLEGQGESERKHPDALPATLPPPPAQLPPPAQPPPAAKLPPSPPSTASVRAGKAVYGSSKAGPSTSQSPASRATSSNPLMPLNPYSRPTPPGLVRSPNGTLMPAGPELAALPAPNQWADVRDMPGVKYGNASLMWKAPVPRAPAPAAAAPPVDVARLEAAADADAMDAPTPRRLAREWDAQLPADAPPANANSPPADVPVLNVHGNASPSASPANAPPANAPPANAPPANPPPANVPPAGANNPDPEQSLWRKIFVSSFRAFGRFMKGIFKNTPRN
ncbi:hypothetical protein DFH27DRAFT_575280 [Peziza echinospora]|nr:hypothetical protein DFH27DRAFT_575280 [Peziza echinospora]